MSQGTTLFPLDKAYAALVELLKDATDIGDDWTYEVVVVNEVYGKIVVKDEDGAFVGYF